MDRKAWPPPASADVLSSPFAQVVVQRGGVWGSVGCRSRHTGEVLPEHLIFFEVSDLM